MSSSLVIVESPAKARTISSYLGDDYIVESSIGHIRDLPKTAAEIPASYKGESWARLGIDVDNDFKAIYVVDKDKRKHINSLKKLASSVDTIYLATDEDREGEAIAWHLLEELSPPTNVEVKRMVFHEITKSAILNAVEEPRDIDIRLVEAQEARRMLDRLYGFEVSPVLWKKIKPKLSAGRVQSVAVRIVVDRERERMQFVTAEYWSVEATLATGSTSGTGASGSNTLGTASNTFEAAVTELDGKRIAVGKDFNDKGELAKSSGKKAERSNLILLDETSARQLGDNLQSQQAEVSDMTVKPYSRSPYPPFITSTLQQEASNRLRLSSADTMRAAQGLYEKGLITYMRTDSTTLSEAAIKSARAIIKKKFGNDYLPTKSRIWKNKVKNAQEAHEAIRPSGSFSTPQEVANKVENSREAQLYDLIYKRTLASQMTDAVGKTASVKLNAPAGEQVATLAASGTVITHPGWQAVYADAASDTSANATSASDASARAGSRQGDTSSGNLPPMSKGDTLGITATEATGHSTKPPARYTEATLVKRLEELGVGRPSTYATIMRTIVDRGYVHKNGNQLVPNFTAFSVVNLLATHFPDLVDYAFTARMEDDLDRIASGEQQRIPWLTEFYFGSEDDTLGLKTLVSEHLDEIDPRKINEVLLGADENGEPVTVRVGRYGPYVRRGDDTTSIPDDILPDELTVEKALSYLSVPDVKVLGADPDTGEQITLRNGRYGPYVQLGEGDKPSDKPKRSSLFASMTPETVTLEEAVQLLGLPRLVGTGKDGEEVRVANGRYGPYVQAGKETRSLESEEQLLTITLEECQTLLSQPKTRGGQSRQPKVLQEIGPHPETGAPITLKDGRYGPYVTDGKDNASLRKGDTPTNITIERALELLELRREFKANKRSTQKSPRKRSTKK